MSILYITQNGITDHIGRSQVAPYLLDLARQGYRIYVLSAEKPGQHALIDQYQKLFDDVGITWTWVLYHNKPPLISTVYDLLRMYFAAKKIVKNEDIRLVHCRSFPPAVIGYRLKRTLGIKYIFDFRDFYADGGLVNKPFKFVYRYLKRLEGPMIQSADKVVCLTHKAKEILVQWYLQDKQNPGSHFQVIPCCADFQHFDAGRLTFADRLAARQRAGVKPNQFVLLYLGSLGPDYLLLHLMALFRQVLAVRPGARFVFVSNNGKELVDAECDAQGVDRDKIRFLTADRNDIPALISIANLSVVFIRADLSKAGCSPTKLAELFACNVPVIVNAGVGDMDAIISLKKNGSVVVPNFTDVTLRGAVEQVIECQKENTVNIRENSREFALEEGGARYAAVYQELLRRE
jgi:glycosyltransferase involved in cell wall biosynthesis